MTRFQPTRCNWRAIAAPMRFAAPVTRTTPCASMLLFRHSRESGNPFLVEAYWMPAGAGMTRLNDILQVILLGIVEGITEFLPISSTGHLLIAEHWLGARSDLFNVAIQAGAILAVVAIYRARLIELFT